MRCIFFRVMLILFVLMLLVSCSQSDMKIEDASPSVMEEGVPFQLQAPKAGDEIVVVETELGTIKFKLFNDVSPNCVEAFRYYADTGYYANASFDRIEPGLIAQIDFSSTYPDEIDEADKVFYTVEDAPNLKHTKGAVSLIYQFGEYISPSLAFVMDGKVTQEELDLMAYLGEESYSKDIIDLYKNGGGMPSFDGRFTVIGQVFEGFEVLEAINQLPVEEVPNNKSQHVPKEPLVIKSFTVEIYE